MHGGAYPLWEQVVKKLFLPFPPLPGNIDFSEHARHDARRDLVISIQLKPTLVPQSTRISGHQPSQVTNHQNEYQPNK
jgi:hypothetical protein